MVSVRRLQRGRWRNARGKSKIGCVLALALLAVVIFYGIGVAGQVFKYYQLKDEMNTQARLAATNDDATIRRRVLDRIVDLDLPSEARRLTVRRTARPPQIVLRTSYKVTFTFPFYEYTYTFRAEARAPL